MRCGNTVVLVLLKLPFHCCCCCNTPVVVPVSHLRAVPALEGGGSTVLAPEAYGPLE